MKKALIFILAAVLFGTDFSVINTGEVKNNDD